MKSSVKTVNSSFYLSNSASELAMTWNWPRAHALALSHYVIIKSQSMVYYLPI